MAAASRSSAAPQFLQTRVAVPAQAAGRRPRPSSTATAAAAAAAATAPATLPCSSPHSSSLACPPAMSTLFHPMQISHPRCIMHAQASVRAAAAAPVPSVAAVAAAALVSPGQDGTSLPAAHLLVAPAVPSTQRQSVALQSGLPWRSVWTQPAARLA